MKVLRGMVGANLSTERCERTCRSLYKRFCGACPLCLPRCAPCVAQSSSIESPCRRICISRSIERLQNVNSGSPHVIHLYRVLVVVCQGSSWRVPRRSHRTKVSTASLILCNPTAMVQVFSCSDGTFGCSTLPSLPCTKQSLHNLPFAIGRSLY